MWTSRERCLLCGYFIEASEMSRHRRHVHEVMPDERTMIDIPVGRSNWLAAARWPPRVEQRRAEVATV